MLVFGYAVTSLAFFGYSTMNLQSGTWDIFWYQITQGVGMSFVFVPLTTLTMDPVARAETGYATSLYSVMRNIGSSMGVSFVTTWVARQSQVHQAVLAAHVTPTSPQTQLALTQARRLLLKGSAGWITASRQALATLYGLVQQQAALLSYLSAFRLMGVLFLGMIPVVIFMRRPEGRSDASPAH
jgi:DHA2 family multidrug resistance protein